ncbi:MAG: hemolysin family protein [Oscillospiraceae bacterium]
MDPDGLSTIIFILALCAACFLAWRTGVICAVEEDRQQLTALGFSNRLAGYCIAFLLSSGFCVFWAFARMAFIGFWLIPIFCLVLFAVVLFFAIGFCKGAKSDTMLDTLIKYSLGSFFTLPAALIFKALHFTAHANVTEQDLLSLVDDVEEQDLIDESQKEMITNIFELDDVTAGDIMTHRTELASVEAATPIRDVIELALAEGFSRMPVYHKTMDEIIGIVYVKDLLTLFSDAARAEKPVCEIMRTAMFVPESCHARELLIDFKLKHTQIAIVVDEYGGTSGLVTMEDVLEEIVGNIQDEFDNEEEQLVPNESGFIAAGNLDLEDLFDAFNLPLPEEDDGDYDSVGGLIIDRLGRIPAPGEDISLCFGGIVFTVIEVGERRILKVSCAKEALPAADEQEKANG